VFPVWFHVFGLRVHPHPVLEALAYFLGFWTYRRLRRGRGDVLSSGQRWSVVFAAALGGVIGSKLLYWLLDPAESWTRRSDLEWLMAGKTMVGGLLGAVAAVEATKWRLRIPVRTGDLFALPLLVGLAVGRVGCFLTGLDDLTYGVATDLPIGIDFGDGVRRHPTQLYEIAFVLLLLPWAVRRSRRAHLEGDVFRAVLVAYLAWRLVIDALKPGLRHAGLTSIQWACVAGLLVYAWEIPRILGWRRVVVDEPA